ncbi:hypothetical protein XC29_04260 [Clostridioides difficile]|nr:hypothetical protein XC29_04260 [Clostridioides difficile]
MDTNLCRIKYSFSIHIKRVSLSDKKTQMRYSFVSILKLLNPNIHTINIICSLLVILGCRTIYKKYWQDENGKLKKDI